MINNLQRAIRFLCSVPHALVLGLCAVALLQAGCSKSAQASKQAKSADEESSTAAKPAPQKNTSASVLVAVIPRSSFSTKIEDGRDPFFPTSERRLPRVANATPKEVQRAQPLWSHLKLNGLWPNSGRPLALINATTVAPGDEVKITVTANNPQGAPEFRKLIVRCLEIRSTSVVISVDGEAETKELFLQSKI